MVDTSIKLNDPDPLMAREARSQRERFTSSMPLDEPVDPMPLGETKVSPEETSSTRRENASIEISVATGRKAEDIAQELDDGARQSVEDAKNSIPDPVSTQLASATSEEEDPESAARKLQDAAQKKQELSSSNGFYLEGALTANDPRYSPQLSRLLRNQQIMAEVLEEKFKDSREKGFFGKSWDFIDRFVLRHIPIGMYEDIVKENEAKGLELAQAAAGIEDPEEYREYAEAYADEKAREGFATDENYFAFLDGMDEAINAGYDPMGNINRVIGIAEAIPLAKATLSAGKFATRVTGISGPKAGAEALRKADEAIPGTHPEIQAEGMARQYDLGTGPGSIKPTLGAVAKMAEENKLIGDIQYLYNSGTFGRVATREQVEVAAEKVKANVEGISSRPIADEAIVDPMGLGDYTSVFRLGKAKDGAPYRDKANADKYAGQLTERGLAARTTQVDPSDPSKGYYIDVTERLDLTKVADPLDLTAHHNAFSQSVSRVLASARQTDDEFLNTLANMGESGMGAIREVVQPYLKPLNKLNLDSKVAIGQVFKEIRDGKDSYLRNNYSESEFRVKFQEYHPRGKKPTEADYDAFLAAKTVHDAAYIMQANKIAVRYVEKGYKTLDIGNGVFVPGKTVNNLSDDVPILSAETGSITSRRNLGPDAAVWKLDRELDSGVQYVASPKSVMSIRYEDVLGYNAGGRRVNPDAKWFVTSGDRAVLTAFTEKQARTAQTQLKEIFDTIRNRGVSELGDLTDELDDVIRRNNDWNPSVENTADFVALAKRKGWRVGERISLKARDDVIEGTEDDIFAGMTMDDYVKSTHRRYDDVLMEFGGNESFNYNPIKAMVDQLSSVSSQYSFRAYTQQSKVGWLKAAGFGRELREGISVESLWASVDPKEIPGAKGRRLREIRDIIDRRGMVQDNASKMFSDFGEQIADFVFEKTKGYVRMREDMNLPGMLLNLGFRSAFGFFNISQFFLQSSHSMVIAAISPRHGPKAAAMLIPLRLAMASKQQGVGLKRLAKFMNMSETDMDELVKIINTSGRKSVENDALEKGTGPGWLYSSFEGRSHKPSVVRKGLYQASKVVGKIDEFGLAAFNEGERLSRWTGIITAFLEYKAKYKGASALSDSGRMFITRREQDLSFNMTTTSRGKWQAGLMKVPTQWLSYSQRALENTVMGRGFTPGERWRMAFMMASMGGATGVFAGGFLDEIGEKYDMDPTDPRFTAMRYGWIDGILSWGLSEASGEDLRTAFGTRIAPLTAFTDLSRKVIDESTLTALGGPSGEIVGGGAIALWNSFGNLISGNSESSWEDIQRVLRTPSGVDNIWKATVIANEGVYRSKSGTEMPLEFSNWEAAMQSIGITNARNADFYAERTRGYRDSKDMREFRKEIQNDMQSALRMVEEDPVRGRAYIDEITARINGSGFSDIDKMSLKRSLFKEFSNPIVDMVLKRYQEDSPGSDFAAKRIQSLVKEDN